MSLNLITKADFVGFINIEFQETDDLFDVYADQAEELVLTDLFGSAMYQDMLANPTEPIYVTLIDTYLKAMMKGYFYYYFNIDRESYTTTIGEFEAAAENATRNRASRNKKITQQWNAGTVQYNACRDYVRENTADYPLYEQSGIRYPLNVYGFDYVVPTTTGLPCDHADYFIRGYKC